MSKKKYENKWAGLEELKPKKKRETRKVSPASQRWAKMSWDDLTKELLYYKMKYRFGLYWDL